MCGINKLAALASEPWVLISLNEHTPPTPPPALRQQNVFAGHQQRACMLQHCLPGTFCCLLLQLAEDLKSALGADSGLGGAPATDYCVLECQQWNSPLYCDHNHTQVGGQRGSL